MGKKRNRILIGVLLAAVLTLLSYFGAFYRFDRWAADALYQHPQLTSGNIIVVGIDERALSELGPFQNWTRDNMAKALEFLAEDPDNLPAVVAIDTLYSGESIPEADRRLAKAASALPAVIAANLAKFGTTVAFSDDGSAAIDRFTVLDVETPYRDLFHVTHRAHINAMNDTDGILRHALLYVTTPEGDTLYSMAKEAAELYAEAHGESLNLPKTGSSGQFSVTYSGVPGTYYEGISIADLINGTVDHEIFTDRIVYIGPYADGLQDTVYTPIARGRQMYGVEYQANVTEMLLRGEYKREIGNLPQAILLFLILMALFLLLQNRSILSSSLLTGGGILLYSIVCYLSYRIGFILHPLWIPLGIFIVYIVSTLMQYILALREKQRVTATFQRYVAPEIVSEILKEGTDSLGLMGKTCDIAVLFVDVRGFTTMSERLSPETVVKILNRYLGMTSACIANNKGTLDKFVGDATMAFWGAPLPEENAVYLAVKTALDIVHGAEQVSKELFEEIGEELHVGVGVHFGPAVVGNIGAAYHMDYTAIGDTVNTAARLEANAPGGTVYVSRRICDELGDRIKVTSLGDTVKLKGKAEGFEVLRVESLASMTD